MPAALPCPELHVNPKAPYFDGKMQLYLPFPPVAAPGVAGSAPGDLRPHQHPQSARIASIQLRWHDQGFKASPEQAASMTGYSSTCLLLR